MATRIEERNGRKYGYGVHTASARQAAHDDAWDLRYLEAKTEVNKRRRLLAAQQEAYTQEKKISRKTEILLQLLAFVCLIASVFVGCSFGLVFGMIPMVIAFVLFQILGWKSDDYREAKDE